MLNPEVFVGKSATEIAALLEQHRKEVITAEKIKTTGTLKVSAKGAVSLYGLGRFPVTLYKSQWTALFTRIDEIRAFMDAHDAELASKAE